MKTLLGWTFIDNEDLYLPDGNWRTMATDPDRIFAGLAIHDLAINALRHATGNTICRCEWETDDRPARRKPLKCYRWRIAWRADASGLLLDFARMWAWTAASLWDPPEATRDFLTTGDPDKRAAAYTVPKVAGFAEWAAVIAARDPDSFSPWDIARCAMAAALRALPKDRVHAVSDDLNRWLSRAAVKLYKGQYVRWHELGED